MKAGGYGEVSRDLTPLQIDQINSVRGAIQVALDNVYEIFEPVQIRH
jgi:hypothetical protein